VLETVVAVERTEAALLFERIYDSMGRALFGAWDTRLAELVAYHAEHARVPCGKDRIGRWATTQRSSRETMAPERKAKLDALPWWRWSQSVIVKWDERLAELEAYHAEHGRLPLCGARADALGCWVSAQRAKRETMTPERKAKLDALMWWKWTGYVEWDARLARLVAYHAAYGRVPPIEDPLGVWAGRQRAKRETMTLERKAKLDALPWWRWAESPCSDWDARFAQLKAYLARHTRVPILTGGALRNWVHTQRQTRETMPLERKERLEGLRLWRWARPPGVALEEYHRETWNLAFARRTRMAHGAQ
jgi:hypothetical protein